MQQSPDPEQEKRVLTAVVLSVLVLWIFQSFVFEPPPVPPVSVPQQAVGPLAEQAAESSTAAVVDVNGDDDDSARSAQPLEARKLKPPTPPIELERNWGDLDELGVDRSTASRWSNFGGSPTTLQIRAYQEAYELDWLPTWLLKGFTSGFDWGEFDMGWPELPSTGAVNIVQGQAGEVLFPVGIDSDGIAADLGHYRVKEQKNVLLFEKERGSVEVSKRFSLPTEGYLLDYLVSFKNISAQPLELIPQVGVADHMKPAVGQFGSQSEVWAQLNGEVESNPPDNLEDEARRFDGPVDWFGVGDRYFLVALEPTQPLNGQLVMTRAPGNERYGAVYQASSKTLAPGEVVSFAFRLYAGPKELDILEDAGLKMASSVNFGMFGVVALPILAFLKFIFSLVGSWGISIILLTVCIKAALFPLSQKSYRSMKGMQKLQPEIEKLKEKHGDDKEAMNREMMALWKEHGVNPLGGCLPMLLQMPIWFALYRVLWNSVELYQTSFLYFADLSLRDPLGVFPLVLGVTMWLQQKMTPTASADPMQQKIMRMMPLFFSVIMFTLPAGLVLYILVNNVLSIGQQWLIHRSNDDGEPVDKAASDGANKAGAKAGKSRKKK